MHTRTLLSIFLVALYISSSTAVQCGSNSCPSENECCNDAVMGPTCYDPSGYVCADNGASALRLCGQDEGACGSICFDSGNYFCCNGQIYQNGQTCVSAATTASPPTASPTAAQSKANQNTTCSGDEATWQIQCEPGTVCCGNGTLYPSCMVDDGTKQCCEWYLGATQCNATEVCGGQEGPGASSYALCGPPDSVFCNQGLTLNKFCTAEQVCCGNGTYEAWCCPHGDSCGTYDSPCQITPDSTTSEIFCASNGGASYGVICESEQVCCPGSIGFSSCCSAGSSCGNSTNGPPSCL